MDSNRSLLFVRRAAAHSPEEIAATLPRETPTEVIIANYIVFGVVFIIFVCLIALRLLRYDHTACVHINPKGKLKLANLSLS